MSSDFFSYDEQVAMDRIRILKDLIAKLRLTQEPCSFLKTELADLRTITVKMINEVRKLEDALEKRGII